MDTRYDVCGIGNALVDVLTDATDADIDRFGLAKGTMRLIDADQASALYAQLGPASELSGGSAANTVVGVASLGGSAAFVGRVRDDQLGEVFAHDIRAAGVHYDVAIATDGPPTGRCLILVTPDAERTMNTFLGASQDLHPDDLTPDLLRAANVTYLEGYLFDPPEAKEAFRAAAAMAREAGRLVALSLSDPFCVDRHRDDFVDLIDDVDLLFANEQEIVSLFGVATLDEALDTVAEHCRHAAVTQGADGATVIEEGRRIDIPVHPVDHVVDTTGAGDLFAAGFLRAYTSGADAETCGRLGALAAAEIVSHTGARPARSLAQMAVDAGIRL